MSKGLAIVAPNADFTANPVGFVNINPLPAGLPSGLHTLITPRRSLLVTRRNRVDAEQIPIQQFSGAGNAPGLSYEANAVTAEDSAAGFTLPDAPLHYDTGWTWLVVVTMPPEGYGSGSAELVMPGDWRPSNASAGEGGQCGAALMYTETQLRLRGLEPTGQFAYNAVRSSSGSWDFDKTYMAAAIFDPSVGDHGQGVLAMPHLSGSAAWRTDLADDPAPAGASAGDPNAGLSVLRRTHRPETSSERWRSISMLAVFDRPLTEAEVDACYDLLKPWLAGVGVEIE